MRLRIMRLGAIAALCATTAFCQNPSPPPLISVSGSAEVKVAPDSIFVKMGVEVRDENLQSAKKENDARISRALAFLKGREVKNKDIQTDLITVEPAYENILSRTKPVVYIVRKSIEVKLTNLVTFEDILTGLLTNGVNTVHGIEFRTSELRKHRDTARGMAIRAAREKADALASELGVKRGKVHQISANDWGGSFYGTYWGAHGGGGGMYQNSSQNAGGGSEDPQNALSIGQISISASVQVSFEIE